MTRLRVLLALFLGALVALTGCSPTPPPEPTPEAAASSSPAERATPSYTPSPTPSPTPEPSPSPTDPLGSGPVTALLFGTDSREPGDLTGRADAIMLAHLPADRSELYLISFTRDTWVNIPGLGWDKLNHAFARGGTEALAAAVSELLGGVEIDFTVQSNFEAFISLTRALGGFTVDNKHHSTVTVNSTGRVVDFPEGEIELTGTDGLIYVRERKRLPMGDLDRTERHRAAVTGILAKLGDLREDPAALTEAMGHLVTNMKVTGDFDLPLALELVPLAAELGRENVHSLMAPIREFGSEKGAWVNYPDDARTAELGQAVQDDNLAAYLEKYGTAYGLTGG